MNRIAALGAVALIVLAAAGSALAAQPAREVSSVTFGPFTDDETCTFPIDVVVQRTRTTTTFENGDVTRHVSLLVTQTANGRTWIDRDAFTVFIDADSPDVWEITGTFTHARTQGGGTVLMQSGRISYDANADAIVDPNPGPHGTGQVPDDYNAALCAALAA